MSRALLTLILGAALTGCASLGVRTEGTSGPIAWHVTDLKKSESVLGPREVQGESRGTYSFTLVLKETQGILITFTYRKDTTHAVGVTVLKSVEQAISLRFKPHEERRFPLSFSWGCAAGDCLPARSVAPIWTIDLTGMDDQGNPVKAIINIKLPLDPDTYRKP